MRHKLDKTRINENPRTNTIENPIYNKTRLRARDIRLSDPQADSDSNRGAERVAHAQDVRGPVVARDGPGGGGEAGAETEAFEGLVEDEDDVEGWEFGAGDGEGQADEDGVEDYAEFEDEDCCHLGAEIFDGRGGGVRGAAGFLGVGVVVRARVAEVVDAAGVGGLGDARGGEGLVVDFIGVFFWG